MEIYDTQDEDLALVISEREEWGDPATMIQREKELAASDLRHSLLPLSVKESTWQ